MAEGLGLNQRLFLPKCLRVIKVFQKGLKLRIKPGAEFKDGLRV